MLPLACMQSGFTIPILKVIEEIIEKKALFCKGIFHYDARHLTRHDFNYSYRNFLTAGQLHDFLEKSHLEKPAI